MNIPYDVTLRNSFDLANILLWTVLYAYLRATIVVKPLPIASEESAKREVNFAPK